MKIKDIITMVDKSPQFKSSPNWETIARSVNLDFSGWIEEERLVAYFIGNWYCTDTFVGYRVYFFDDKPVAISFQTARKSNEEIEWLSVEDYFAIRNYIISKEQPQEANNLADLEEEIGDTYKIHYHGQLFDYHKNIAMRNGENVTITEYHKGHEHTAQGYEPSIVKIVLKSGAEKWLELSELDFPFNLTKK